MQTQNNFLQHKQNISKPLADTSLIEQLYDIGAVQFGEFKLKSGITAPIYLDLRRVISYPTILYTIAQKMCAVVNTCKTDSVCGVPYAGIPFATSVALLSNKPMIMPRKEVKAYGAKRAIEGVYKNGDTTIIIEDIMTTGSSTKDTYEKLTQEHIMVKDVVVFCLNKQKENVPYKVHALFTLNDIVNHLHTQGKIDAHTYRSVQEFLNT